ncbi:thioredoxin reductase [Bacillus oleivorans]|uniref:Thioredoxin reductase n=1 Tax=Bacillus oleivorans TaxID=1448271 RepID=A0A285D2V9_9BACI|nr:NAD(P)/FAD-dependent oxidoreductase [Bacillus oleivorans]SNX74005.1 thioredoxin reductase [Bacillus oleivorans]
MRYDCIIVGGGIAGLQAAIQLGRYNHKILIIDANSGRSNLCRAYHNILGWPEGISGEELRDIGKKQAQSLGVEFVLDRVEQISKESGTFYLWTKEQKTFKTDHLLLATGVMDRLPPFPKIYPCLGISVYICPDCDGYEVMNKRTIVLGTGNVGANMALTLYYWTNDIVYINLEFKEIDQKIMEQLQEKNITVIEEEVKEVLANGSEFKGIRLMNGILIGGERGFIALGGNHVKSELAVQLGVEIMDNKHIQVNPRTKMTNVENVWAAGDVAGHSEQVTIAMGDGSQAAIWIHKSIMKGKPYKG